MRKVTTLFALLSAPLMSGLLCEPAQAAECPEFDDVTGTMADELPAEFYSLDVKEIDEGLYMVEVDFLLRPANSQLRTVAARLGDGNNISPAAVIPLHLLSETEKVRTGVLWANTSTYANIVLMVTYDHFTTIDDSVCIEKRMTYAVKLPDKTQ